MTVTQRASNRYLERPAPSSLADVIDTILDKGLVIDLYVRVSLVGIELLTIDARIVIASVDTYLRFAEAVGRLDLTETETQGIPELMENITQDGSKRKTEGAIDAVKEKVTDVLGRDEGDEEEDYEEEEEEEDRSTRSEERRREPARKRTSSRRRES